MEHCVIHPSDVKNATLNEGLSSEQRGKAATALTTIEGMLEAHPDAIVIDRPQHPGEVADYFKTGDSVMLYGAYYGMCLQTAYNALVRKGAHPEYHPEGCI